MQKCWSMHCPVPLLIVVLCLPLLSLCWCAQQESTPQMPSMQGMIGLLYWKHSLSAPVHLQPPPMQSTPAWHPCFYPEKYEDGADQYHLREHLRFSLFSCHGSSDRPEVQNDPRGTPISLRDRRRVTATGRCLCIEDLAYFWQQLRSLHPLTSAAWLHSQRNSKMKILNTCNKQ